ncbi:MAG: alanine dehydrogenase [Deltaproteobacteria bacterium]|nr:alanine dehydrogenase [Deltaproteobacteria bacterium]MBW2362487.1 alanine dehydrogenase [Deltaproteobacteria bacterium]
MRIGVPKEIKVRESRVALVPAAVRELVAEGHEVWMQSGAAAGVGLSDAAYVAAGARIAPDAAAVFRAADLVLKVKEPQPQECRLLRRDQVLFTFLHLAADPAQADALMASGATAIAYETVTAADGSLPLLTPMSEVAGRMSIQVGAHCLEQHAGGSGVLLAGVPGVEPGRVVILGGGVAGSNAAQMALGLGADVTLVDLSLSRLRELSVRFGGRVKTVHSTRDAIAGLVRDADLVVGAVLVPGDAAPKLVTREMLRGMKPGSVLVDIAIDQGGCFETSRPTSHEEPTFVVDGVVHYCVTNMPGAVARTSTFALCNATLPYVRTLASRGLEAALAHDAGLAAGVNVRDGAIVHEAVAAGLARTRRLRLAA